MLTNTQTHKQTDTAETSNAVRYIMTLGNNGKMHTRK